MKETITIKNFGGLKDVTIPLNSINIFIGKQASGKSVTAKLIYFFRKAFEDVFDGINEKKNYEEINEEIEKRFQKYFPVESWSKNKFSIKYNSGELEFVLNEKLHQIKLEPLLIERKGKREIKISSSKIHSQILDIQEAILEYFLKVTEDIDDKSQEMDFFRNNDLNSIVKLFYQYFFGQHIKLVGLQIFIPAGRSFFSNIQSSIFSILATGNSVDPFLVDFGSIYERTKSRKSDVEPNKSNLHIQQSLSEIVNAEFISDKTGDYLVHTDGRKINLLFCSSGQQEALPLILILKNIAEIISGKQFISNTIYIEEPEAHLFPSAQKRMVEMIATVHNVSKEKSQLIITTHSPYILTSFNNLLEAGQLLESGANKKKLFKIVPEFEILKPGELNAYAFADGGVTSLIDEETGLISADLLDQVSEEIAIEFNELLNL